MNPEPDSVDWDTPTRVTGEWVTLDRALSRNDGEVIATIELSVEGDVPVYVEVVDTVPQGWEVSEVGVHPQFVPETYKTGRTRFEFADTVEPGDTLEVVYGFKVEAAGYIDPPDPPVLEEERQVEAGEEPSGDLLGGEDGRIFGDEESPPEFSDMGLPEGVGDDAPARATAGADEDRGEFTRSPSSSPPESAEEFRRRLSEAAERTAKATSESSAAADDDAAPTKEDSATVADRPVTETLADELASGDADEETVDAIRSALGLEGSTRDRVQVKHLQSRVEEFAAYADALGDLIDEYGALDEFFDDHVSRVEDIEDDAARVHGLETDLVDLRETLEEEAARRKAMAERVDDLDGRVDDVADLADDLEGVQRELDQLRRQHGDDIDDLSDAIDGLEATVEETLDGFDRELDALRAHAKEWTATRKQLADRLAPASLPDLEDA